MNSSVIRRFLPLLLFGALFLIYESNADFLQVNDATANVYLPLSVLRDGDVVFAPSEAPNMFVWEIKSAQGMWRGPLKSWATSVNGVSLQELYDRGELRVLQPLYFLVPTQQRNARGETLYANTFGPGAGLTALPAVVVASAMGLALDNPGVLWYLAKFVAAILTAASGVLLFAAARLWLSTRASLLLAFAYGLGTSVWSLSSQTLWQQTASSFLLALGFYLWLRALRALQTEPELSQSVMWCVAGAALAFGTAVACRPTSLAPAMIAAGSLLLANRRAGAIFVVALLPPLLALGAYNFHYLGSPLSFGQSEASRAIAQSKTGSPSLWQTPLWLGAAGLLFSPSRGLFVFSPFLLAIFIGLTSLCDERWRALRPVPLAMLPILLAQFMWFDWWGGWSYGPRPLLDVLFPLFLLLIPAWRWLAQHRLRLAGFGVLLLWSVLVQFVGAFAYDSVSWNNRLSYYELRVPGQTASVRVSDEAEARQLINEHGAQVVREVRLDIDKLQYRWRLWSLNDNQIMYYLTHFAATRANKRTQLQNFSQ